MDGTLLNILIAEDEITHAIAMRRMLEKRFPDALIRVVESIRDFRASVAESLPTIALLDLNLTDGCSLGLLDGGGLTALFPVIMLSSYASNELAARAVSAGASDFIIKSPEVFLAISDIVSKAVRDRTLQA